MEVNTEGAELSAELRRFIDQLIVPLLVEELLTQEGHFYTATGSYSNSEAAEEAA